MIVWSESKYDYGPGVREYAHRTGAGEGRAEMSEHYDPDEKHERMMGKQRHPLNPWWWLEINAPDWVQGELAQEKEALEQQLVDAQQDIGALTTYLFELESYVNVTRHKEGWERLPQRLKEQIFPDDCARTGAGK